MGKALHGRVGHLYWRNNGVLTGNLGGTRGIKDLCIALLGGTATILGRIFLKLCDLAR